MAKRAVHSCDGRNTDLESELHNLQRMGQYSPSPNLGLFEPHAEIATIWNGTFTVHAMDCRAKFKFRSNFIFLANFYF